jgi:hypothetical protein
MAPTLTPEDVVRRIASECAYIDERGGVGIRLEPAARSFGNTVSNSAGSPAERNHAGRREHRRCCDPLACRSLGYESTVAERTKSRYCLL